MTEILTSKKMPDKAKVKERKNIYRV